MRRPRSLALALSVVALVGCMAAEKGEDAQAAPAEGPSDAFLDSTLTVFLNAMKAKDATPTADLYAENAVSYPPNAAPLEGKNAIIEYNKAWFASVDADSIAAGRDGALSSGDLAVETGWYYFKGKMGGQALEDRGRYMNVWQRQGDGSWKMVRDMANSSMPMPGAPPTGASKK